jgi:hypothetical protein
MENKAVGTLIVTLAIGALLGFGGGYYYLQPQVTDAFSQGMAYQQSVSPTGVTVAAAEMEFTWDTSEDFDHTGTVDVNGDVAADTEVTQDLTIANVDDTLDAKGVILTLTNPTTGKSGIDKDLIDALDDVKITITYGGLSGITMLKDSEYKDRNIGDIPCGADMTLTVSVTLLKHTHGDFPDGATIECELYVWQPGADSFDTVDFTIST